jgi:phage tail sheath gpL-like
MLFLVFASSGLEAKANVNMSTQVKSDGVLLQCSTSARIQPAITAGYDHRHDR